MKNIANKNNEKNELIILSSVEERINHEKEDNYYDTNNNVKIIEIKKDINKIGINIEINETKKSKQKCLICEEELTEEEIEKNLIECYHGFCNTCILEYLKEKINTNNVIDIKCPKYKCETILNDAFIKNHLKNENIQLLEKYKKFKIRHKILLSNKDLQECPYPDCDSYAYKNNNDKYVTCYKGHKFCLKCLKPWHEDAICETEIDENFENWKKTRKVERCPKCKYYIEKIEGCNHITCVNCRYNWCWLCKKEYKPGHYKIGERCEGLLYEEEPNYSFLNNKVLYYFKRAKILFSFYIKFPYFFMFFVFNLFVGKYIDKIDSNCLFAIFIFTGVLIAWCFYIQLYFIGAIVLIVMLIYWPFQRKVLNIFLEN